MTQFNPTRGLIHHIIIPVTNVQRSGDFYGPLFTFMGYDLTDCSAAFQDWRRVDLGGMPEISIVQVKPHLADVPYVRGAVGHHHHIAFHAESRQAVDDCYMLLLRLSQSGGKVMHPPQDYPQYSEGYYAVFFEDPDGLYLEFTHTPNGGKKQPLPGRRPTMKILLIPALTLPEISAEDLARIRAAAGSNADVIVTTPAEAQAHARDAEVILGSVPRTLFQAAPKLRWVQATSSGVDAFLYPEFRDSQVVLTSEKGMVGEHLADHAFGLLLMLTRQLNTAFKLGPDAWNYRAELRRQQVELSGLTMGIIGFGSTGRAMARRAHAFGMHCQAIDRDAVPNSPEVPEVQRPAFFAELLSTSDVVAICCPLTPETRGLFDHEAFAHMKPSAFLVNVTRGEVISEDALVRALQTQQIRGAALDVVPREPLPPDSALWDMGNVVMTPHTAGASQYRAARNMDRFVRNIAHLRQNEPLEGVINKQLGY